MLDDAPASITIHDTVGRFLYANRKTYALHGYTEAEYLGISLHDLDVPESAALLDERVRRIAETGETSFEVEHYRKDRSRIPLSVLAKTIDWHGVPAILSIAVDITERKRAEAALEKARSELQAIYDHTPVMICLLDEKRRVLHVNRAFIEFTGGDGNALIEGVACGVFGCINAHDAPQGCGHGPACAECPLIEALESTLATGRVRENVEKRMILDLQGARKEVWLMASTALIRKSDGVNLLLCMQDITARKHDEEERERLREQLTQAQKMESVGRLAGGVAHDFNNMLGVILGHAELALEQIDPEAPLAASLAEIEKAASRSAELTRQLLAFARRQTASPRALDLNSTVGGMFSMLRRLIGEDISLVWAPDESVWPVYIDPSQVDQILANLCVNSRDAIDGVGRITIETQNATVDDEYCAVHPGFSAGEYVRLVVSDNGSGMDRETIANMFDPFFTTKPSGKGTGLGLATVYGIVKQNSGYINVYSEPGEGTSFSIYLPRYRGDLPDPVEAKRDAPAAGRNETILLVEDEPMILALGKRMLERLGYTVFAAGSPVAALEIVERERENIRLLLTDIVMPGMNGRDLATEARKTHPELEVIFTSGYTANVIAHHGVLEGGLHFIQKPFDIRTLGAKIREVLDNEASEPRGEA
jgi:two-component system, cell cycle sensor histidine kinase and response regulator CckA